MNEITRYSGLSAVSEVRLPVHSVALQRHLHDWSETLRWPERFNPNPPKPEVKAEAEKILPAVEALLVKAPADTMAAWLERLGVATAGKSSPRDARVKIAAYGVMLDHPARCFTEASLKRASIKFHWFPSFSEVHRFLNDECSDIVSARRCLRRITEAPVYQPPPEQAPLKERQAQTKRLAKEFPDVFREPAKGKFTPSARPHKPNPVQFGAKGLSPDEAKKYWDEKLGVEREAIAVEK